MREDKIHRTPADATHRGELDECLEHLGDQINGLVVDAAVQDVEELGCLGNQVHGLDVVRLLPQVVL